MKLWQLFVAEVTRIREDENPLVNLRICRKCGATDNGHDPHIPEEYQHEVDEDSCSRCDEVRHLNHARWAQVKVWRK